MNKFGEDKISHVEFQIIYVVTLLQETKQFPIPSV